MNYREQAKKLLLKIRTLTLDINKLLDEQKRLKNELQDIMSTNRLSKVVSGGFGAIFAEVERRVYDKGALAKIPYEVRKSKYLICKSMKE